MEFNDPIFLIDERQRDKIILYLYPMDQSGTITEEQLLLKKEMSEASKYDLVVSNFDNAFVQRRRTANGRVVTSKSLNKDLTMTKLELFHTFVFHFMYNQQERFLIRIIKERNPQLQNLMKKPFELLNTYYKDKREEITDQMFKDFYSKSEDA